MTSDEILSKAHMTTIKMLEQKYDGMTNGEVIETLFPNAITRICKIPNFTYVEVEQNDKWMADFDIEWWNARYKEKQNE